MSELEEAFAWIASMRNPLSGQYLCPKFEIVRDELNRWLIRWTHIHADGEVSHCSTTQGFQTPAECFIYAHKRAQEFRT